MFKYLLPSAFLFLFACQPPAEQEAPPEWQPQSAPIMTRWAADVSPNTAYQEYPRPQMVREQWLNLNGLWEYAITDKDGGMPNEYQGNILVPFPIESALSGVKQMVQPHQKLWYRTTFTIPEDWSAESLLLHFGAVDWEATVYINGQNLGTHRGGYDPFTLEIQQAASAENEHEIIVEVWDPTDEGKQPTGKQTLNPRGIWYTPTTGIWQTVWVEPVPTSYIEQIRLIPNIDEEKLTVAVQTNDESTMSNVRLTALDGGQEVATQEGSDNLPIGLSITSPKLWSPDSPFLYDLTVELTDADGNVVDKIESYFGMRKISVEKADDGYNRLFLNNEPLFQLGPLDQGFWPDGLYTAPSDAALKYDVEATKQMGFNMARKHVKVEPARWYYWCDKLGLLVWQDMPSGEERVRRDGEEIQRTSESAEQFETELTELIDDFYNHPSIVMWVIFNEGWGQYETARLTEWAKEYDSTRLINPASGWLDMGVGDVNDMHKYPGPGMPEVEDVRVAVLGEFGGQALVVPDHLWVTDLSKAPTHFKTSTSADSLLMAYSSLYVPLDSLKKQGLAAAVYTQTTDVESEVNGLMTYDRAVIKMDLDTLQLIHEKLYD
ncbi:glycoside hydrolase family 2 protein [Tunicatimonas pelagia]|uniref:glycoside hydrolase family 2 protein n=1 Tax=Tunicatimonas pelagia TaxID=931531 RepID=UPI002666571F|nr:glycoside hydrolase family 2 TIM barrel-domain containing protein [Tunicatimonas pelagia]WKN42557.1 glycoside hydrolase family 2 TIM barrel-domain containing protein [Tunicatimonas pelagia]